MFILEILKAIIIGAVEGITEWLPISSTGHMILIDEILKLDVSKEFLEMFLKVFDYTYKTFPNPDRNIREWIQIRTREGAPQEKVVALPVKDPYHIIRNVILIIELLEQRKRREEI